LRKAATGGAAFIPKTGPSDGSREVNDDFFADVGEALRQADGSDVFPSPAAVGVVAVTMTSFPLRLNAGSESSSSFTFPLCDPKGSNIVREFRVWRATA